MFCKVRVLHLVGSRKGIGRVVFLSAVAYMHTLGARSHSLTKYTDAVNPIYLFLTSTTH